MFKQMIGAFGVLAVVSAFADDVVQTTNVQGSNVFGILRVDSASQNTIVAIPWVACDDGGSPIAVSNIVKTANLTAGDMLYLMGTDGAKTQAWQLQTGAGGVLYWQSVQKVTANGSSEWTASANAATAARGSAILLYRQNTSSSFYLYGQVATSGDVETQISTSGASTDSPVYNLIAPPCSADVDLIGSSVIRNPGAGDQLSVPHSSTSTQRDTYTYKDGAWGYTKYNPSTGAFDWNAASAITVPAGMGFWYVSVNSGSGTTCVWPTGSVPHTGN